MDAVTREQLAVVLYRYTEKYLDMDASSRVVLKDVYRDYEKISRWAEDGMSWASATGLMEGYPDGTVRPRNGEKRSEIAAMFHRTVSIFWTCNPHPLKPLRRVEHIANSFFVNLV